MQIALFKDVKDYPKNCGSMRSLNLVQHSEYELNIPSSSILHTVWLGFLFTPFH